MSLSKVEEAELRISRAFFAAAIRRDPKLAEVVRKELRAAYSGELDDDGREAIEFALTIVDATEKRAESSLEAPPGTPQPRG